MPATVQCLKFHAFTSALQAALCPVHHQPTRPRLAVPLVWLLVPLLLTSTHAEMDLRAPSLWLVQRQAAMPLLVAGALRVRVVTQSSQVNKAMAMVMG